MPSDPTTGTGKRLVEALFDEGDWPDEPRVCITAIEAEARATLLDELRGEVEELDAYEEFDEETGAIYDPRAVMRAAVLALLDDHKKGAAR